MNCGKCLQGTQKETLIIRTAVTGRVMSVLMLTGLSVFYGIIFSGIIRRPVQYFMLISNIAAGIWKADDGDD